jgi:hypothetical protein
MNIFLSKSRFIEYAVQSIGNVVSVPALATDTCSYFKVVAFQRLLY